MNFRIGLKGKITIIAGVILLIMTISGLVTVNKGLNLTKKLLGQLAFKAASTAFEAVEGDKLKDLIKTNSDQHPYYKELQDKLRQSRKNLGLEYLYIMTKNTKGDYIYLVDGLSPDREDFSQFGDVEDNSSYFKNFQRVLNGETVYDDFSMNEQWGNLVSAYLPIKDSEGNIIAFLGADLDATDMLTAMNKNTIFMIIFVTILSLLGILVTLGITYQITSPIIRLRDYSMKVSRGESASVLDIDSKDELGDLAYVLNSRISAIRNILNNIDQGFLTFDEDMRVDSEYSLECKRIFGGNIEGKNYTELLYPNDMEQQRFIGSVFEKVLKEKEPHRRSVYLPLLADEILINDRSVMLDYKVIESDRNDNKDRFMVILTDVTEKRELESLMEKEKDILRMVVKTIVNHNDFLECIRDYKNFCTSGINRIVQTNQPIEEVVYEFYRNIHTFKGNFGQLDMDMTAEKLHELEDKLSEIRSKMSMKKHADFKAFIEEQNMLSWLDGDLDKLMRVLGEQFLNRFLKMESALLVDKSKLIELENKILTNLSSTDCKLLLPQLRRIRCRPFKELLRSYPEYVSKLAERMGKQIKLMVISGEDFIVESERYNDFTRALTHVFRNAVDHGIEAVDERVYNGKEEYGRISCNIKLTEDEIIISVKDDGRGMDIKKIRQRAIEKGLIDEKTAFKMTQDDIIRIIFTDDFSTKQEETEFSGRGVGLAAVKKEVDRINGTIEVRTKAGKGTEFIFKLPLYNDAEVFNISIDDIMNPLMLTARDFLSRQLELSTNYIRCNNISKSDKLKLHHYSALTEIKGVLSGKLIISFNDQLAESFADKFVIGEFPEEYRADIIEDSVSECLNIVLGNSIKMFPGLEDFVVFTSPATIKSDSTVFKYPYSDVWTCDIVFDVGTLSVNYITNINELERA